MKMQMLDRTTQYLNPQNVLIHLCIRFNLLYITLSDSVVSGEAIQFLPCSTIHKALTPQKADMCIEDMTFTEGLNCKDIICFHPRPEIFLLY